ncbi:MAG TPA: choice-of-anchor L domain-containing protein [Luteibaculaceae bacterium]|nr:choice-of-anchor L domain-containing protein [Luteibaculaceae bacterium]
MLKYCSGGYIAVLLLAVLLQTQLSWAQLQVSTAAPYNSKEFLLQNVLLGEGVKAFNLRFYGNDKQIGYFSNASGILGLQEGIVLSTGNVDQIVPPQADIAGVSTEFFPNGSQGEGDPDLSRVAQEVPKLIGANFEVEGTFDAAILEFDFIPSSDSVYFRYVFGSEEYLRYVDTKFNDVFGFFISGPGINGTYSSPAAFPDSAINIAFIPATSIPITVSSVNDRRNSSFYIDNPNNNGIVFNGYTRVFTAFAKVIPCQTYHIKIAIADGTKRDLDSGVMIEARSFTSGAIVLSEQLPVTTAQGEAIEGCFEAAITARREGVRSFNDTVYVSISPQSQANAQDISPLPPFIVIPAGSDSARLQFTILEDAVAEGNERLTLDFNLLSTCADLKRSYTFSIADVQELQFAQPGDEVINMSCFQPDATLDARVNGGYGFYSHQWFENGVPFFYTSDVLVVNPQQRTVYTVVVSDSCGITPITKNFEVIPYGQVPLEVFLPDTFPVFCINTPLAAAPQRISGPGPVNQFSWTFNGQSVGIDSLLNLQTDVSGWLKLEIRNTCNQVGIDSAYVDVASEGVLRAEIWGDSLLCQGEPGFLEVRIFGGYQPRFVQWLDNQSQVNRRSVMPTRNTLYKALVADGCGVTAQAQLLLEVIELEANFTWIYPKPFDVEIKQTSKGNLRRSVWIFDGDTLASGDPPYLQLNDLNDHLLGLYVEGDGRCVSYVEKVIQPQLIGFIPTAFTPDGDGINDELVIGLLDPREVKIEVFDRYGRRVFLSRDLSVRWNGRVEGSPEPAAGVYTVVLTASRADGGTVVQRGMVVLLQ